MNCYRCDSWNKATAKCCRGCGCVAFYQGKRPPQSILFHEKPAPDPGYGTPARATHSYHSTLDEATRAVSEARAKFMPFSADARNETARTR